MDLRQEFGAELQRLRKRKSLTQRHLADLANVDSGTISRLELGKQAPQQATAQLLAKELCKEHEREGFLALADQARRAEAAERLQAQQAQPVQEQSVAPPTILTLFRRVERQNLRGLSITAEIELAAPHVLHYEWQQPLFRDHEISLALDGVEIFRTALTGRTPLVNFPFTIDGIASELSVERGIFGVGMQKQHLLVGGIAIVTKPSPPYFLEKQRPIRFDLRTRARLDDPTAVDGDVGDDGR